MVGQIRLGINYGGFVSKCVECFMFKNILLGQKPFLRGSLSSATVHFCQEVICYPNLVQKISHFGLGQFYF